MSYKQEVIRGMQLLAQQPNVVFVGQGVSVKANCLHEQLVGVPEHQRLEVPVFENTQLGMCLGMALTGLLPVCLYPRLNFLYCAWDQLCNHTDKWRQMTGKPAKVIIKTILGATKPLDPGPQHSSEDIVVRGLQDFFTDLVVEDIEYEAQVSFAYERAAGSTGPTLLIERGNLYG